ncbi:MAG: hypothetical protein M3290_04565, partial [Actinomycetota bacterium]|nr:hypothetical protein [Actinomycetota bacterium]
GGLPRIAASSAASASNSPTAVATETNPPTTPTPENSPTGPAIQLLNPSRYENPVIVSDNQDSDSLYHFVAVVAHPPANASVEITIQQLNSSPTPSPVGNVTNACVPATKRGTDTFDCFADLSNLQNGSYRVTARLVDPSASPGAEPSDSQDVQINHSAPSLEITSPTDASDLGFYQPSGHGPGFVMSVKYSNNTSGVKAFYTTSPIGVEPQWRRCTTQVTTYFSDHTATIGCEVAGGVSPGSVTGVAALSQSQPPPVTIGPNCTTPAVGSITCPQPPVDQSGDAHRVLPYVQTGGGVTLDPQNQTVARNGDNSQCATVTAIVLDQKQKPVWRANVDVHATGPNDATQFAVSSNSSPFKQADQDHDGAESAYNCSSKGNDTSHNEAIHTTPDGADTKHIESIEGTDTSGSFVFAVHASADGTTTLGSWWDLIDNDGFADTNEHVTAGSVEWGGSSSSTTSSSSTSSTSSSTSTSSSPTATATATTSSSPSASQSSSSAPPSSPSSSATTTSPPPPPPPVAERTTVTINYDANARFPSRAGNHARGAFKGKVKAGTAGCRNRRRIRLVKVHHGVVAKARSHKGEWKILFPNAHGKFYAKALRKVYFDKFGRKVICKADTSPKIHV